MLKRRPCRCGKLITYLLARNNWFMKSISKNAWLSHDDLRFSEICSRQYGLFPRLVLHVFFKPKNNYLDLNKDILFEFFWSEQLSVWMKLTLSLQIVFMSQEHWNTPERAHLSESSPRHLSVFYISADTSTVFKSVYFSWDSTKTRQRYVA